MVVTLGQGESVGDIDVLDHAPRGVSCIAMEQGREIIQTPNPEP
jgi:CRP-like cAMP-binding protein